MPRGATLLRAALDQKGQVQTPRADTGLSKADTRFPLTVELPAKPTCI